MSVKSFEEIPINIKMRFIGYYMSEDQFMRTESIFPEKAEELASLLQTTYNSIITNRYIDDNMLSVFKGNTVFILKGENKHLYGFYPRYNVARITKVRYIKPDVTPMPEEYKSWFHPGEHFHIYKPKKDVPDESLV